VTRWICLFLLCIPGCIFRRTARQIYEHTEAAHRNSFTTVEGCRVYKYPLHPDHLQEDGQQWFCWMVHPRRKDVVFRVMLHQPGMNILSFLRQQTREIIQHRMDSGEEVKEITWIYNDDFHVGAVVTDPEGKHYAVEKKIVDVLFPHHFPPR